MALRHKMSKVSAMDEFARWARLKRQLDKASADYEKMSIGSEPIVSIFNAIHSVRECCSEIDF